MNKTYFNWSTGKDSALTLYSILQDKRYSIEKMLTVVNGHHDRVSMHGVRRALLEQQLASIGIPGMTIELPEQPGMNEYEQIMKNAVVGLKKEGYDHAAFGDIFLEDLRKYREDQLAKQEIKAIFPLWKKDTRQLIHEFIDLGFKSIVVCVKAELLDESFAGRIIDHDFLNDLPDHVDPCGENGEFHTFCFDGPIFKQSVSFEVGEKIYREYEAPKDKDDNCFTTTQPDRMGFWFCDLIP